MTTILGSNRLVRSLVDSSLSLESPAATGAEIITVRQNANTDIGQLTSFTVELLFGHHLTEYSAILVPSPTDTEESRYWVCSEKCPSRLDKSYDDGVKDFLDRIGNPRTVNSSLGTKPTCTKWFERYSRRQKIIICSEKSSFSYPAEVFIQSRKAALGFRGRNPSAVEPLFKAT